MVSGPELIARPDGSTLAYDRLAATRADTPGVVFLHGLMSDRSGTKAEVLLAHCRANGLGFVRFDMSGHGASSGRFEDGSVSRWTEDALAVLDAVTSGPLILVGSSMGAWVMIKTALARAPRIAGLIGVAPAPDFTEDLMWAGFSAAERATLEQQGMLNLPSTYDTRPYVISRGLIEDGRNNLVLRGPIPLGCPVRLVHGQRDGSVPWQTSLRLAENLSSDDVDVILIKDGDHRLSRPQDLQRLCRMLDELVAKVSA